MERNKGRPESQYALCCACLSYLQHPIQLHVSDLQQELFLSKKKCGSYNQSKKPNVKCDLSTYPHPVMLADSDLMLLNRMYECKDR